MTCGKTGDKMVADHKTPLVKEHYETGKIDKAKMRVLYSRNAPLVQLNRGQR